MKSIKGNILLKLHNCFSCHKPYFLTRFYPKIQNQYFDYLFWIIKQYQFNFKINGFTRNNVLMNNQTQNLSIFDIKNIALFLSNEVNN